MFYQDDNVEEQHGAQAREVQYGPHFQSSGVLNRLHGGTRLPPEFQTPHENPFVRPDITRRDYRSMGTYVEGRRRGGDRVPFESETLTDDGLADSSTIMDDGERQKTTTTKSKKKQRRAQPPPPPPPPRNDTYDEDDLPGLAEDEAEEDDAGGDGQPGTFGAAIPITDIVSEQDTTKYDECPLCSILIHCKGLNGEKRPEWFDKFAAFSQDATFKIHPQQKYRTIKAFYDREVKTKHPEFGDLTVKMAQNHYLVHMKEPSCMLRDQLDKLDAIIDKLSDNIVYSDLESGRIAIDNKNMKAYSNLIDLRFKISKTDPTRMIGSVENFTSAPVDVQLRGGDGGNNLGGPIGAKRDTKQNVKM